MKPARFTSLAAAAALLAGCSSQSTGIAPASAIPILAGPTHAGSWMSPEARKGDLLYLSSFSNTYVLSYPQGELVGRLDQGGPYLCTDKAGDVFLTQQPQEDILEYAHGGTTPIATLQTNGSPWGCSVDPVSGDLAVAINDAPKIYHGYIAIYKHARGGPEILDDPDMMYPFFCTYDSSGNLFIDGTPKFKLYFAELPRGSKTFTTIGLNGTFYADSDLRWDGTYVSAIDGLRKVIDRIAVSGSQGTFVSSVHLRDWHRAIGKAAWIHGGRVIAPPGRNLGAAIWHFPQGGEPFHRMGRTIVKQEIVGVAVSFAR